MKERRQLVELWRRGGTSALITLVRSEGSSYRRPGARMLLSKLHGAAGTISGGCLEAEVSRKAPWLVQHGARIERILTQFDDTSEIPFGLGCGGTLDLLLEPAGTPEFDALLQAMESSLCGARYDVHTWLPELGTPLRRAVWNEGGDIVFASASLDDGDLLQARLSPSSSPDPELTGIFAEHLQPPQRLVVSGAGDDAKPLVGMAVLMGWDVLVMDGRAQLARAERFPEVAEVMITPSCSASSSWIKPEDAVVLMSHSFEQDREMLAACMAVRPRYVGLLGARHRSALLLSEVAGSAGLSLAECCMQVHAPIGLDLGGDGPEAIALAIVAEVQACCMGKPPGSPQLSPDEVERYVQDRAPASRIIAQCTMDVA